MLNSNFDLRTFLTESKAPKEQIQEATLTEATVMEYIREKMDHMNNEVRSCMREYLTAVNEIDPGHEDAHAQLMGALEDFYNKLKAHFEEDEAEMEQPLATTEPAPSRELDGSPMYEGEEEDKAFGGEEDEEEEDLNEGDDYIPRDKEDLVYTFLQDAFKLGAMKGGDFDPSEELSAMAISLVANLPDYDSAEVGLEEEDGVIYPEDKHTLTPDELGYDVDETINEDAGIYQGLVDTAMNMGSEKDTALFLAGLVKTVVHLGAVPALVAALYPFKDKPVVQKLLKKLEKFVDAD